MLLLFHSGEDSKLSDRFVDCMATLKLASKIRKLALTLTVEDVGLDKMREEDCTRNPYALQHTYPHLLVEESKQEKEGRKEKISSFFPFC